MSFRAKRRIWIHKCNVSCGCIQILHYTSFRSEWQYKVMLVILFIPLNINLVITCSDIYSIPLQNDSELNVCCTGGSMVRILGLTFSSFPTRNIWHLSNKRAYLSFFCRYFAPINFVLPYICCVKLEKLKVSKNDETTFSIGRSY